MDAQKSEIAAVAARLVVEDGLEYGLAKKHAAKELGWDGRAAWPSNDEVEDAVREYIAVFLADSQPRELAALRVLALQWIERLREFRPYLSGAVWLGTATRHSDIYLNLYCDDSKAAEIALIDRRVPYEPRTLGAGNGQTVEALSVHAWCEELQQYVGVHLLVHDLDDFRGALRPDGRGRTPRGSEQAVRQLVHDAAL